MKVLIAEDYIDLGELWRDLFKSRGFETVFISSCKEACDLFNSMNGQCDFTCAVVDMSFGYDCPLNGIEVIKRLKGKNREIKIAVVTGSLDERDTELVDSFMREGLVNFFYRKPLSFLRLEKDLLNG